MIDGYTDLKRKFQCFFYQANERNNNFNFFFLFFHNFFSKADQGHPDDPDHVLEVCHATDVVDLIQEIVIKLYPG